MIKTVLILTIGLLLVGCASKVPVQIPAFPEPPEILMRPAPDLTLL